MTSNSISKLQENNKAHNTYHFSWRWKAHLLISSILYPENIVIFDDQTLSTIKNKMLQKMYEKGDNLNKLFQE